ncbi:hypothetical protein [Pseudoalteromonas sp. 68 DY56-GL68]|uniref:hypothetical protein n=1 Tax=Pseudoalteromonas sp. 68 DY56-GL68 TaxID=2974919 RepID=UPI00352ADDAB
MKSEIKIVIISSLLAFVGAGAGSFLSFELSENAWERDIEYKEKRLILDQRIKLIERAAKIFALLNEAEKNSALIGLEKQRLLLSIKEGKEIPAEKADVNKLSNRSIELRAEYTAVLSLLNMYFGPETKLALQNISKSEKWYKPSRGDVQAVMNAVSKELHWFDS